MINLIMALAALTVPLPPGRTVVPVEGQTPVLWVSDAPPNTIGEYASLLIGAQAWRFWWD